MKVVALHGFLGAPHDFAPVLEGLPWQGLRVPFHGLSEDHAHYTEERERCTSWRATLEQIAHELPEDDLVLVGYSLGARLALGLAFALGDRVRALIAISGHAGLPAEERAARAQFEQEMAHRLETQSMQQFVDEWVTLPLFATQATRVSAARRDLQRRTRLAHDPQRVSGAFRVLGTSQMPHYEAELRRLQTRATWLAGERDDKYRALAVRYATSLGRAEILAGGHNLLLEAPQAVADAVRRGLP